MPPSTPSSLEMPVYTSTGVSSPNQMYHLSAQTRVSTVLLGMFLLSLKKKAFSLTKPHRLDPSIRVTYHPRTKKVSQSGFYSKSSTYTFTQRITVHNTKSSGSTVTGSPDGLKIKVIDQVPISEDSTITVKLIQPLLVLPTAEGTGTLSSAAGTATVGELKAPPSVKVAQGVVATWDGADEFGRGDVDIEALGKEGRFCWICSVPSQGKIGLVFQWEVSAPASTNISGL